MFLFMNQRLQDLHSPLLKAHAEIYMCCVDKFGALNLEEDL